MKQVILLTALGLAAAGIAVAAESGAPSGAGHEHPHGLLGRLQAADTNHDGMISRDEAKALPMIARNFDAIDANHDGQITKDELKAFHQARMAEHFKRLDTDGDGRISKAEAQANAPRLFEHFDQIDANGDGFLTPEELQAARHRHHGPKP